MLNKEYKLLIIVTFIPYLLEEADPEVGLEKVENVLEELVKSELDNLDSCFHLATLINCLLLTMSTSL